MVRKIAANYILLPGYSLVKNGYVLISEGQVIDVIDTGGQIREIQGLEFYGGMLVAGALTGNVSGWRPGDDLITFIRKEYAGKEMACTGLALIKKADLVRLVLSDDTVFERLV